MSPNLTPELYWAALVAVFTAILWVPIILNRIKEMELWPAIRNPQPDVRPKAEWAYRLAHAHRNAVENLVIFAPLAIGVHVLGIGSSLTAVAAAIYFFTRTAHAVIYTAGIPLLRSIAFFIGFACQMILAGRILGWL